MPRDTERAQQRLAVFHAARLRPDFEQHIDRVRLAGAAERQSSLFRHRIGSGQELADKGECVAALKGEERFQHLSGDGGFGVAAACFETQQQGAIVALHFGEGAGGVGPHRGSRFGERVDHVAQHLFARHVGTGGQGQQAEWDFYGTRRKVYRNTGTPRNDIVSVTTPDIPAATAMTEIGER